MNTSVYVHLDGTIVAHKSLLVLPIGIAVATAAAVVYLFMRGRKQITPGYSGSPAAAAILAAIVGLALTGASYLVITQPGHGNHWKSQEYRDIQQQSGVALDSSELSKMPEDNPTSDVQVSGRYRDAPVTCNLTTWVRNTSGRWTQTELNGGKSGPNATHDIRIDVACSSTSAAVFQNYRAPEALHEPHRTDSDSLIGPIVVSIIVVIAVISWGLIALSWRRNWRTRRQVPPAVQWAELNRMFCGSSWVSLEPSRYVYSRKQIDWLAYQHGLRCTSSFGGRGGPASYTYTRVLPDPHLPQPTPTAPASHPGQF